MIQWKPFSPKALDFLRNANARLNIADGSVRSSKTVTCTVRWLAFLVEGPPGDLVMCGKTVATLQRNVLNDIFDILGPKNARWTNRQQGEMRLLNRRVYCVGANNEDAESKIRGATLAGAYCDEVNLYPYNFFAQLMARLSIKGAMCFCNCNPDSPYHWFYLNYITNDAITNKRRWRFTMDDNPSLDSEYVASLKQMYSGVFYRRFIEGEWCVAEGIVYPEYTSALEEPFEKEWQEYCLSIDYGTQNAFAAILWARGGCVWYAIREYRFSGRESFRQKTDSDYVADMEEFTKDVPDEIVTIVDPSATSFIAALRRSARGFRVRRADNDVLDGIRDVSVCIQNGLIKVFNTCEGIQKEFASYAWMDTNDGKERPQKVNDHFMDALRYFVRTKRLAKPPLRYISPFGG